MNTPTPFPSRRDFLRYMAIGGATVASGVNQLSAQLPVSEKPMRKAGIALLGIGNYATTELVPALRETEHCRLVAAITGHPEKGARLASEFGFNPASVYTYDTMDRISENPEIDIVYVVTPPSVHRPFVERAAKAGKHVISEKPIATTLADCDAMIAACKAAKVKLSIGYRMHFDPYHQELMRLAREGDFGEFKQISGGFGIHVRSKIWRIDRAIAGGGPMMDVGIYVLHAACIAAGASPISVTAHEQPKTNPELFESVEEAMTWEMKFPNGAICKAETSFNRPFGYFRAEGSKGWFELPQNAFAYRNLVGRTSRGPLQYPLKRQQAGQMDDFALCVLNDRPTSVPGELGRRDLSIIKAIYESAAKGGQPIELRNV